jgi:hypothetical protein
MATRDGKNYRFSAADQPGIVYLPAETTTLPVDEYPRPSPSDRTNAWLGLAGKAGTQFVVVGIETVAGAVASLDDVGKWMAIGASINRLGPGVGATGGVCIVYITGVKGPADLKGHQQGDWDFNVSLGGNWGKMAKSAKAAERLQPLINALKRLGASTPGGLKSALKAHPDKWVELIKTARTVKDYVGIDPNGPPNVLMIDLPLGGGVELSGFYGLANIEAMWDFSE